MMSHKDINLEIYKRLFDLLPDFACIVDLRGFFIEVNNSFIEKLNYTYEELIGKSFLDFLHKDDIESNVKIYEKLLRGEEVKYFINRYLSKNGEIYYFAWNAKLDFVNNMVYATAKDLTDIITSEKKLEEIEERNSAIVQNTPESIIIHINGDIVYANPKTTYLSGYSEEELLKMNIMQFISKESIEIVKKNFYEHIKGKETKPYEATFINKYNKKIDVIVKTQNIMYKNERATLALLVDITELRSIEKKFSESQKDLELVTSSAKIGLWDWKIAKKEFSVDKEWANIIGYKLEELEPIDIKILDRITKKEDLLKVNKLLRECFAKQLDLFEYEIMVRHKNEKWIWVLVRGKVIEWNGKVPARMVGTQMDITERKNNELIIKYNEDLLNITSSAIRGLFDNVFASTLKKMFYKYGKSIEVDRVYLYKIDKCSKKISNHSIWQKNENNKYIEFFEVEYNKLKAFISYLENGELFLPQVENILNEDIKNLFKRNQIKSIMIVPIFSKGTLWGFLGIDDCNRNRVWTDVEKYSICALANSLGKSFERDLINKELEMAKEKAENSNNAKTQFLANISHEIRTPLNAIIGFSELLKDMVEDETQKYYIDSINIAGNNLLILINDILDLSKIESGKMDVRYGFCNLKKVIDEIHSLFEVICKEKNMDFVLNIDEGLIEEVIFDEGKLRQILLNLVGNAVKFTSKGYVKISVFVSKKIKLSQIDLKFIIEDTGIGILEENFQKIFENFRQMDNHLTRKYEGTGLGLAICKKLVELLNGKIELSSEINIGSIFSVEFNDVMISIRDEKIKESIKKKFDFSKLSVLIINDNNQKRDIITEILQYTGIKIFYENSVEKSIEKISQNNIDVIVAERNLSKNSNEEYNNLVKDKEIIPICICENIELENKSICKPYTKICWPLNAIKFCELIKINMTHKKEKYIHV